MAGQLCTNCHAPLETAGAASGAVVRCGYCKTDNRVLGAGMAHAPTPGFGGGFGPPPGGGFGTPPQGGFGAPPQGGFGAPPQAGFGAAPPGGFGAPPPGVIGGPTGLPGMNDANPKGYVAPPPSVVVPSSAGTNAELLGGVGALLAWKGLMAVLGLIVPAFCCLSWIALQFFVGAMGH